MSIKNRIIEAALPDFLYEKYFNFRLNRIKRKLEELSTRLDGNWQEMQEFRNCYPEYFKSE